MTKDQPETLATGESIPLNFNFIKYEDPEDEEGVTEKVEIAESIPLDYKFVHYQNDEGDELIKLEDANAVPLDFHLLQLDAPDADPSKIESLAVSDPVPLGFRF